MAKSQIKGQMSFFGETNVYVPPKPKSPNINKETNIDLCTGFNEDKSEKKEKGKGITKAELQDLFKKAITQVKDAGIPVPDDKIAPICRVNTRATSFWGKCHKTKGTFWVEVVEELLTVKEKDIMNTLVHEVLHTCKDCMNHGPQWKAYANIMNQKYGYNIKRTTSAEEKDIVRTDDDYKYIIQCEKCKTKIHRQKTSRLIQHPNYYRCKCGGKLNRIK